MLWLRRSPHRENTHNLLPECTNVVWFDLEAPDKELLLTGLPAYIQHRNKQGYEPRISARNWHAYAREGRRLLDWAP